MADEEFHFSNGEILMKETFLIFFFPDERTSYMTVSYSAQKKRGKKKCEISSQWHFKLSIQVVDLDPCISESAKSWFQFKEYERMKIIIEDGLKYILLYI